MSILQRYFAKNEINKNTEKFLTTNTKKQKQNGNMIMCFADISFKIKLKKDQMIQISRKKKL